MPVRQPHELTDIVSSLLGPPPGRRGERSTLDWWLCPLHPDRNPSFTVDPVRGRWRCYGCGASGDDATLIMKVRNVPFPVAKAELLGGMNHPAPSRPRPAPAARQPAPAGLSEPDARALVEAARARLWSPQGASALEWLTSTGPTPLGEGRCLIPKTIKAARLGWTPGVRIPTKGGGSFEARGVTIPWLDGDRLAKLNIRQPDGHRPKYREAYRDRPRLYPNPRAIRPGLDTIVVEGDFEALIVQQAVGVRAQAMTRGSASGAPDADLLWDLTRAPRLWLATDAAPAGDRAAGGWLARARRVRPPAQLKYWTEFVRHGADLGRWWGEILDGVEHPPLFTYDELTRWPGLDPEPGIVIEWPDPARRRLALEARSRATRGRSPIEL
jgi:hypothetical protein